MATVNRSQRILAGRQLRASFFHMSALSSLLWLEDDRFREGLTLREKERLKLLSAQLNEVQNALKEMAGKIRHESL